MRVRRSARLRQLVTLSAGFALVACSETPSIAPVAAPEIPRVTPHIAANNPSSDGYIVVLDAGARFASARIGGRLSAIVPVSVASSVNAMVVSKVPSINAVVVRGIANPSDIELGRGVTAVVPNYNQDLIDPTGGGIELSQGAEVPEGTNQSSASFFANNTQWGYKRIQANRAWAPSRSAQGVKVCIVDTGIDDGHSAFVPNAAYPTGKVVAKADFVGNGTAVDSVFHGTHVAGTISTNGFGWASVATNASLMIAKVFDANGGGATTGVVLNAVAWCADNGADIINMSLGFNGGVPRAGNASFIAQYQAGLDYATNQGVLIVASAGNDAAVLPNATNIWLPAESNGVVSVAALGPVTNPGAFSTSSSSPVWANPGPAFDGIAGYSNRGTSPSIAVAAPGGANVSGFVSQTNIMSPCSRFYHPQAAPPFTFPCGSNAIPASSSGLFGITAAGTSMASPHVAGVAAIIRGRYMSTPRSLALRNKIEACLYKTVDPLAPSTTFGRGRVNTYKAATTPC